MASTQTCHLTHGNASLGTLGTPDPDPGRPSTTRNITGRNGGISMLVIVHPRHTLFVLAIRVFTAPHLPPHWRTHPIPSPESRVRTHIPAEPAGCLCFDVQKKRESIKPQHPATFRYIPLPANAMAVTTSLIFASKKKKSTKCAKDPQNGPTKKRNNVPWSPNNNTNKIPGDAKPAGVSQPSTAKKEPPTTPKNALSPLFPFAPPRGPG
jgi:hypothetical protein